MNQDDHLVTDQYDPEKYWSARASGSEGKSLHAVCVSGATEIENRCADRTQRRLMESALKHVNTRRKRVLEYGCGAGRWIEFFQRRGWSWSGVDISSEMLEMAKKQNQNVELRKIEESNLPSYEKSFELVYSVTVVHHNPYDQQRKIMAEMVRILRDDGYLILFEGLENSSTHFNMFPRSRSSWISLAESYGLTCIWCRGARYWILRNVLSAIKRRLIGKTKTANDHPKQQGEAHPPQSSFLRAWVGLIDLLIDPYLAPLVPARYQTAALMVFKKGS